MTSTQASTIVVASLFVAACATIPRAGLEQGDEVSPSLAGTRWIMQAMDNDATPGATTVTLDFGSDGRISGTDGCNQYQGSYTADASSLTFAPDLIGTLAACPEPVEGQAGAYRGVLQRTARFEIEGARLDLYAAAGALLATFAPAPSSPVGTEWEAISYNNGRQGAVSVIIGTQITARFGDDGQVTGSAGCNQYFAAFTVEGQTLRVGMAGVTRRFCADPEGVMDQENLYLAALQSAATFQTSGDRLELRTVDGALAVSLTRRTDQ